MDLSFGGFQIAVLIGFLVVSGCLVVIFSAVARTSRRNVKYETVVDTGYRLRRGWLVFLAVLLGTGLILSLSFLPYGESAGPTERVKVTAYQFNWSVSPEKVRAGTLVDFEVTSSDVNHGLGLYDPDGVLIGNVQAMPDFENVMSLRLDKPGTYVFGCLEYCGLRHHMMLREFEVTP